MNAKRRTADGRFARETPVATAAESIGLATVAAGLVIGAYEQLSPAVAAAQQGGRSGADRLGMADHTLQTPPAEAAHAPLAGPPDDTPLEAASIATLAQDGASHAASPPGIDLGHDMMKSAPDESRDAGSHGSTSGPAERAASEPAEAAHMALADAAESISTAMKTLLGHVEGLKIGLPGIADLQHQFDGIAEDAGRLAQEISSAAGAGLDGIDLSEILGGPALPVVPETVDALAGSLGDVLSPAGGHSIPATLLGAAEPDAVPGLPATGFEIGSVATAALDLPHDAISTRSSGDGIETLTAGELGGLGAPPLQLGFLGQSYTDSGTHHDSGSHGLVSPLHGFV